MRRTFAMGALLVAGAASLAAAGALQQEERRVAVQSMGVAENLYVVSGGGGHTALLITQNHGVVLVDTKNPGWGPSIMGAVQALTDQPVTTIINTHAHGDHVGSNPHFAEVARVVAHENARESMARSDVFAGGNDRFLPTETYGDRLTLFEGLDQIDLYHFGPGHTNGDTIVVFRALEIAHTGDLFARKAAPFIDRSNGGSGVAYPETLARAAAGIEGVTRVIPGHAPPPPGSPVRGWMTWDDVREYAEFMQDLLDDVRASFEAGRSAEEAAASLGLREAYPDYDLERAGRAVQAIYDELEQ